MPDNGESEMISEKRSCLVVWVIKRQENKNHLVLDVSQVSQDSCRDRLIQGIQLFEQWVLLHFLALDSIKEI